MAYIIAFEGIDGTGKGTQMQCAAQYLENAGLRVGQLSFPIYESFFGHEIGDLLTGRDGVRADSVDGKSMALWFALDRFEAFQTFDLSSVDVLLINRYVLSNAVYQSIRDCDIGKPDLLDFVMALEHEHFGIPRVDACLLFDMDLEQAAENVGKKGYRAYVGSKTSDIYESIPELQRRAREKYLLYAAGSSIVHVIPCMEHGKLKSIDAISLLVRNVLDALPITKPGEKR